jgi:hypothetical protein
MTSSNQIWFRIQRGISALLKLAAKLCNRANRLRSGQAVMEWVMLLGVIIVPMTLFIFAVMTSLEGFYALTSWMIALPFP